jgi:hypothetical protein
MGIGKFITDLPSWALFLILLLVGVLVSEVGSLVARNRVKKGIKEPETSIGTAVAAMLGLLAFMLGFIFSITASRYAERKEMVVKQANAIGTCYLRTSLIPGKQKDEIRQLFRKYTDILLEVNNSTEIEKDLNKLNNIHILFWNETVSAVKDMEPPLKGLLIGSVNDVIDVAGERGAVALIFKIPNILWIGLLLIFLMCLFAIGYQTGTYNIRRIFDMPLLAAAFALVIMMIADMDSTGLNHFKVSQQPLRDVRMMMNENIQ